MVWNQKLPWPIGDLLTVNLKVLVGILTGPVTFYLFNYYAGLYI